VRAWSPASESSARETRIPLDHYFYLVTILVAIYPKKLVPT
jgi:hypothetical protein